MRRRKLFPLIVVSIILSGYIVIFALYHHQLGNWIGVPAAVLVIVASWFFGVRGGMLALAASIVSNISILWLQQHSLLDFFRSPVSLLGIFSLTLVAFVTGRFVGVLYERRLAIEQLQQYEHARESHTQFLERLNQITARVLQADSLQLMLEILTEHIAHLFHADDVFFNYWDETQEVPIPTVAYGSLKEIYAFVQFEPGQGTLSRAVMREERSLFVPNLEDSPYISPDVAAIFPSRSMLGIPLITSQHRIGALLVGFNHTPQFNDEDMFHVELVAEHIALLLSKAQLLEEERKRVRQLTALHDVALTSIEADHEDQLIERVTDIIGKNLFPDNFGIMLLDEKEGMLRTHPSYRFYAAEELKMPDIRIGIGITGQVAASGQPQRLGNVRRVSEYVDVDDRTISELCVPIKFKEQILGVINAESTKRDAFTMDDERLLVTLAGQLATAIQQFRKAQTERVILAQLAHDKDLIYSIARITAQIERSMYPDQIIKTMGDELEKIGLTCILAIYDESRKVFTVNYTSLPPRLLEIVENGLGYPLLHYDFPLHKLNAIVKKEALLRPAVLSDTVGEIAALFTRVNRENIPRILEQIGVADGVEPLRLPLVFEETLLGMLWTWGQGVTRSDLPILSIFAKQIGMTLERARLFQEVQSLALTDPLTGLQNRRSLFELGRIEFSRAQRMGRPFSCMMLDADHFKKINDAHGHPVGDEVLQEIARRCKCNVREVDLLGRYGGEEFMLLLPETDMETAVNVAERIRTNIALHAIETSAGSVPITVSIGVAAMNEQTTHLDALVARADQALYIAKHKGRNRVSISI